MNNERVYELHAMHAYAHQLITNKIYGECGDRWNDSEIVVFIDDLHVEFILADLFRRLLSFLKR